MLQRPELGKSNDGERDLNCLKSKFNWLRVSSHDLNILAEGCEQIAFFGGEKALARQMCWKARWTFLK